MRSNRKIVLHKLNFFSANITMCVRVIFFCYLIQWNGMHILFKCIYAECWVCLSFALCKHKTARSKNAFRSREEFYQISMLYYIVHATVYILHKIRTACERHFRHFIRCSSSPDEEDYKSWYWNGNTSHICATILDSLYENQIRWILA